MKDKQYKDDRGPDWEGTPMFPAKSSDPDTSFESAHEIMPILGNLESTVLKAIRQSGSDGLTGDELAVATDMLRHTCCPRTATLKRKGLIVDSGERRKGVSGKKQVVWKAVKYAD
tara:strand:+ start:437 stop:781 length:345 start_codon:yes stop_codon:yes gene_type:complete